MGEISVSLEWNLLSGADSREVYKFSLSSGFVLFVVAPNISPRLAYNEWVGPLYSERYGVRYNMDKGSLKYEYPKRISKRKLKALVPKLRVASGLSEQRKLTLDNILNKIEES